MSFSNVMKTDLCRLEPENQCCGWSELAALVLVIGSIEESEIGNTIKLVTENVNVAKRAYFLVKEILGISPRILIRKSKKLKDHHIYFISFAEVEIEKSQLIYEQYKKMGIAKIIQGHFRVNRVCCRKAFLRGVFLGAGSITNPNNYYHVEIVFNSKRTAESIVEILGKFDIVGRISMRKKSFLVYIKDVNHISDFLNIIGAHKALLDLENVRILKEMRNSVNRLVNCETANLSKIVEASLRQKNAIEYLKEINQLDRLPKSLRELAYLRLQYPDSSLKELGMMLEKPVGKSGVNHRLNKIEQIAESFRS